MDLYIVRTDSTTNFYADESEARERYSILVRAGFTQAVLMSVENPKIIDSVK